MRAWRFHEFGDISNLVHEEGPMPEPGEGEALVEVEYASLNPADYFMVMGKYPRPAPRPFRSARLSGALWRFGHRIGRAGYVDQL